MSPKSNAERSAEYRARKAVAAGRTPGRAGRPVVEHEHGKAARYAQGCRCDLCKTAHAARVGAHRAASK